MPFPLGQKYVQETEKALNASLPASYTAALMADNGGEIFIADEEWFLFPIRDGSEPKRIARTANHIIEATKNCFEWPGFPKNAIALAEDQCGNYLVFLKNGKTLGPQIYYWDHENPAELTQIAEDYSELLNPDDD